MKKINTFFILKILFGLIFPLILIIIFYETELWGIEKYFIFIYILFWIIPLILFRNIKYIFTKLTILNVIFIFINYLWTYSFSFALPKMEKDLDDRQKILMNNVIETLWYIDKYDIKNIDEYINNYRKDDEFIPLLKCYYLSGIEDWKWFIIAYKYKSQVNVEKYWEKFSIYKSDATYNITNEVKSEIKSILDKDCLNNFFNTYYLN